MAKDWEWTAKDAKAAAQILAFLPDAVFDFHAHLYSRSSLGPAAAADIIDAWA